MSEDEVTRDMLYDALQHLMNHFLADENGDLPADLYSSKFWHEELREWYPKALSALAKARGEQA